MARPTKLTEETKKVIVAAIRKGVSYKHAAALAGISETALKEWQALGRAGKEPYAALVLEIEQAQALGVLANLKNIEQAGLTDWRASAWVLERRFPEDYGNKSTLKVQGDQDAPLLIRTITAVLPVEADGSACEPD